jgi:spore coat polysaccharide biosynthesis protein SpsF
MVRKVAVIQARLMSTRLPGKILKDLCGKTLLERVVNRVKKSKLIDEVWIATSTDTTDDIVELIAKKINVKVHRGSLDNVLERFCEVGVKSNADIIIRVTADNPFTEPRFIDEGIRKMLELEYEYLYFENIPYGTGVEIVKNSTLKKVQKSVIQKDYLEHVTLYIIENQHLFDVTTILPPLQLRRPDIRLTIDTLEEYIRLYKIHFHLQDKIGNNQQILLEDVISLIDNNII